MTDEIRRAMDARLSALEGSPERRVRIRAQINATESKEEPIMKRKFSMSVALVLALMLLSGTALAAGLGLNLFEYFGKTDSLWANLADRAVLETEVPVKIAHEALGQVEASITNAYYDGQGLLVAFVAQDGQRMALWTPGDDERANLEAQERPHVLKEELQSVKHREIVGEVKAAEAAGKPVGFMQREIYPGAEITANGVKVMPNSSEEEILEDGTFYQIFDYEAPLPEGVRYQATLELSMPLYQLVTYHWFDGSSWYGRSEGPEEVSPMTATVKRDATVRIERLTGAGEVNGVPVTATVDVSSSRADVTITAAEDVFVSIPKDEGILLNPWEIDLTDEQGRALRMESSSDAEGARTLHFSCYGTGDVPESLTLLIYQHDWMDAPANIDNDKAAGVTITLTRE